MQKFVSHYRKLEKGEKIEVLFMFQAGTVWASLESVYKFCMGDERYSVKIAWIEETTVEKSHMMGAEKYLKEKGLDFCRYEELDFNKYIPHVVFIQFPYDVAFHTPETLSIQFKRRGTRVVYVPYGIEISDTEIARKDHFHSFVVENAWRIYTCCEGIKKEYDYYCHNRGAVRVSGSPKFDAISCKETLPLKTEIKDMAKGRKIVIWKMHFPKKIMEKGEIKQITPYVLEYIKFAEKVDGFKDIFFVILAHPKMLNGIVSSDIQGDNTLMMQVRELMSIISRKENTYIDTSDEYRNSLYHADAIIMDRSAVVIEAAMLDVPVLFMKNRDYSEAMTLPVQNVVNSFEQGICCEDMIRFLNNFLEGIDTKKEIRHYAIEKNFPYNDGKCGKRIVEDIAKNINNEHKRPNVVLYGTGEICHYYIEKKHWNSDNRFNLIAIADSNRNKWGIEYYGFKVVGPDKIGTLDFDAIVITTEPHYFEIKKSLVYEYYLDEKKIWRLDDFIVELGT